MKIQHVQKKNIFYQGKGPAILKLRNTAQYTLAPPDGNFKLFPNLADRAQEQNNNCRITAVWQEDRLAAADR